MAEKKQKRKRVDNENGDAGEHNELLALAANPEEAMNLVVFLRDRTGVHFSLEEAYLTRTDSLLHLVIHEQGLPAEAHNVFSLWLVSPLMDIRLKKQHNPFDVVQKWDELCARYTDATNDEIHESEPVLMVQRDVFFRKEQEQHIQNEQILCLLYQEAKYNVVEGRYVLHSEDYHYLAGIQALIHLGSFDPQQHILADYRANLVQFYPEHMFCQSRFAMFSLNSTQPPPCEELFMDAHRKASEELQHIASSDSVAQLYRKYLELLWTYPFYGGAFFSGIVEAKMPKWRRVLLPSQDFRVNICINTDGITLFNKEKCEFLLYVPYSQLSWRYQDLEWDGDSDPPPTLMLQFLCNEQCDEAPGQPVTKLLQIYSREAKLMDALIETCVKRKLELQKLGGDTDLVDGGLSDAAEKKILNKLEKLCLETYTVEGDQLESS
ncbi:putative FERM domain-containing protein FRMD8P1 [Aplysia californica]|uniref:FERM domain-containing protein 8 n=1 Tax=Aplysia californica TaxID=6500 RepID=A0ABM0JSL1_APLCA|nr:putative FERM domain-containing protein FRMD8P1 [Aplysia californica]